jgi:hypothetical protein
MRRLVSLVAAVAALAAPGPASAANSGAWDDYVNDATYPHVDVQRTALVYDDDGYLPIGVNTGLLVSGDRMEIYVDIDRNASTGWLGADAAFLFEQYGTGATLGMWVYDGGWTMAAPRTLAWTSGTRGVALVIHASELWYPSGVRVFVRGGHANAVGTGSSFSDWAPNSGSYPLDFGLGSSVGGVHGPGVDDPAPAPTTPAPAPVVPTPSPTPEPTPAPVLTLGEARAAITRLAGPKVGARATLNISGCTRAAADVRGCTLKATRGPIVWSGSATAVEFDDGSRTAWFRGKRIDRACQRAARTAPARARCTRAVYWTTS